MVEMNPYYAHSSDVGDVFDVATWSPRKVLGNGIVGALVGILVAAAAVLLWNPQLLANLLPELAKTLEKQIRAIDKQYTYAILLAIISLATIAYVFVAAGLGGVFDAFRRNIYFRAGPGGLSIRVLRGVAWDKLGFGSGVLCIDLPWSDIDRWAITQKKQFGSLSRNAGNLDATFNVLVYGGRKYSFSLDFYREPARIIYERIQTARETKTAVLAPESWDADQSSQRRVVSGDKHEAIVAALTDMLRRQAIGTAILFSDVHTGRFVQFVLLNGDLLLDLPLKSLHGATRDQADAFFRGLSGRHADDDGAVSTASVALSAVTTQHSYQVNLHQELSLAADLTLEVFDQVLDAAADFELSVEEY